MNIIDIGLAILLSGLEIGFCIVIAFMFFED